MQPYASQHNLILGLCFVHKYFGVDVFYAAFKPRALHAYVPHAKPQTLKRARAYRRFMWTQTLHQTLHTPSSQYTSRSKRYNVKWVKQMDMISHDAVIQSVRLQRVFHNHSISFTLNI